MGKEVRYKRGMRVQKIGPLGTKTGKTGTITGISKKAMKEGLECYRVLWDGQTCKTTCSINAEFLKKLS